MAGAAAGADRPTPGRSGATRRTPQLRAAWSANAKPAPHAGTPWNTTTGSPAGSPYSYKPTTTPLSVVIVRGRGIMASLPASVQASGFPAPDAAHAPLPRAQPVLPGRRRRAQRVVHPDVRRGRPAPDRGHRRRLHPRYLRPAPPRHRRDRRSGQRHGDRRDAPPAREFGLFVGPSSGAHLAAARELRARHPALRHVVTFFCDEGEKYINDYFLSA